jgi:hypothetical protein
VRTTAADTRSFVKRLARVGLVLSLVVPAFGRPAEEKSSKWTVGAEFDFNSRYIWRSLAFSQGPVWQPSVWAGISGFSVSAWGNFVLDKGPNVRQFNEWDYRFSYAKKLGRLTVEPAFTIYSYPNQIESETPTTGEVELLLSAELGPVTLETAHFFDVWENSGGYIGEVGIEVERKPLAGLTVTSAARVMFANAKFNAYYVPLRKPAVNSFVLELRLTYAVSEAISFRPHIEWNQILDEDLSGALAVSRSVSEGKSSLLNFGIAFVIAR